jgi:hypothetical protein
MSSAKMDINLKKSLDYINLVLQILENLLSWSGSEDEKTIRMPYLVIDSNSGKKIQRAYIIKENQIVSFAFPFHIYEKGNKWHVRYKNIYITSSLLSHCKGLYSDFEPYFEKTPFYKIASALESSDSEMPIAIQLFEILMLIEPAYVRYDYDPKGAKGLRHPCSHFDYNFTDVCHYKIGLHSRISLYHIEDMINKDTDSWYVAKYHISSQKKQQILKARLTKRKKKYFK